MCRNCWVLFLFTSQGLSDCSDEERKQRIHSIQTLHALELFDAKKYALSMKEFIKLNTDPVDVLKLFPELDGKTDNESTNKLKGKDLEDALNALIEYLVKHRSKIGITEATSSQENTGSQRNLTQQMELIDTTLLKCYLQVHRVGSQIFKRTKSTATYCPLRITIVTLPTNTHYDCNSTYVIYFHIKYILFFSIRKLRLSIAIQNYIF